MDMQVLKKAPNNDRFKRRRPESNEKVYSDQILISVNGDYTEHGGEFAREWAKQYKGDQYALPTFNEVMNGILQWYINQTEAKMPHLSEAE